jgi:CRP/FNR family transcriptional regulator, anaerobic regulatory protein
MERPVAWPPRPGTFRYRRGEVIFTPGDGGGLFYLVRAGVVRIAKALPGGRTLTLGLLGPNAVFVQEDAPGGATAVAIADATVTVLGGDELAALLAVSPSLAATVVAGTTRRQSELQSLVEQIATGDEAGRVAAALLTLAEGSERIDEDGLAEIDLPSGERSLADLVGLERAAVADQLRRLEAAGIVRIRGNAGWAVDRDRLRAESRPAVDDRLVSVRYDAAAGAVAGPDAPADAVALSDPDGVILAANPAYAQLYGYSLDQVVGQPFAIVFPEEQRTRALDRYRAVFAGPAAPAPIQAAVRRADGSDRVVEARVDFVYRGEERVAMVSMIRDVTGDGDEALGG